MLTETNSQPDATRTAEAIAALGVSSNWIPMRQRTNAQHAHDAYVCQITGKVKCW